MFLNNSSIVSVLATISVILPMCYGRSHTLENHPKTFQLANFSTLPGEIAVRPLCQVPDWGTHRAGLTNSQARWEKFNVHMHPSFDKKARKIMSKALRTLQDILPCVKFALFPLNSPKTGDFVHVVPGSVGECWSVIGRARSGEQLLTLGERCVDYLTVLHELIHALGVHHEQCRCDRDDHVQVFFNNIVPAYRSQFQKVCEEDGWSTYGVPYNIKSIMHYQSEAGSSNGKPTMLTKGGSLIPASEGIQDTDIRKLQKMYGCGHHGPFDENTEIQ